MRALIVMLTLLFVALAWNVQPAKSQIQPQHRRPLLFPNASNQAAMRECRMQMRGHRGGIRGKDKFGLIEGCYVQKTGKLPWQ
jgi:hypothetical protein